MLHESAADDDNESSNEVIEKAVSKGRIILKEGVEKQSSIEK